MPKGENQKLKLLYLKKILLEKTDEEHTLTINDMIDELSKHDITAERKSISDDMQALRQYGLDIVMRKTKTFDYYIANRDFELPELKLLADAVASSKFITAKKSNMLIKKIENLASNHQAKQLQRQVFVTNRVKTVNEKIYYNVDTIHSGIADNRKISFQYFEYTVDKNKRYRNDGDAYIVSPYALSWDDENYYLICHYEKHNGISHFRVDKMENIKILDDKRLPFSEHFEFNLAEYTKKVFSMFGGEEETVKLQFDNSLVGVVLDRFGKDVQIEKVDDTHFAARFNVAISPTFLGWIFQFGDKAKILSPVGLVEQMKVKLIENQKQYE